MLQTRRRHLHRFEPGSSPRRGCQLRRHMPELLSHLEGAIADGQASASIVETALAHAELVLVPFEGFQDSRRPVFQDERRGSPAIVEDADGCPDSTPLHARPRRLHALSTHAFLRTQWRPAAQPTIV